MNNNMINTLAGIYTASLASGALMAAARMRNQRALSGPGTDSFELQTEPSEITSEDRSDLLLKSGLPVTISAYNSRMSLFKPSGSQFNRFSSVA